MSQLPTWIKNYEIWPTESDEKWPHKACGIGCDMRRKRKHDAGCPVVKVVAALTIAWEALQDCREDRPKWRLVDMAMRRIEALGKDK